MRPLEELRRNLITYFNLDNIQDMCFDLGISYENLRGDTLNAKVRELLGHCIQHRDLDDLIEYCRRERPNVSWPEGPLYTLSLLEQVEYGVVAPARLVMAFSVLILILLLYWSAAFDKLTLWVGGWYKSWYFREFNLPSELHGFSDGYYRHASWSTNLSAISGVLIAFGICLCLYIRGVRTRRVLALFVLLALLFPYIILSFWPFRFDPYGSIPQQFIGSRDYSLWAIAALVSTGTSLYVIREWQRKVHPFLKDLYSVLRKQVNRVLVLTVIVSLLLPIVAWGYLAFTGYFMGKYHGYAAIWEGKMNVRWAKTEADNKWWIFVTKRDDGVNILYNREDGVGKFFANEEIKELDGPVTRDPKN